MEKVFVTVGTTKFDQLINKLLENETIKLLELLGCRKLVIQKGFSPGEIFSSSIKSTGIVVEIFDYAPSIINHIKEADFVIGHSGAGTVLDVLRCGKPLLVVINDSLMDNHQTELADKLSSQNYLKSCTVSDLLTALQSFNVNSINKFPSPDFDKFPTFLDSLF
ncbi:UDP-N-acetylglucosamine transferase subunit ALG13 homolog [Panonychus citri]|uniref:UDP-N-acetylglucosamine transferase subunit ALG13 homolog n=1 Tax=Panonychus citri TaxID=50023 RepID=UPI0023074F4A|nr:UDP-N-acetylglucosamine transferase subunit ALG13 homolog [Panonychus citri]